MLRTVVLPASTPIDRAALSAVMRSAAGRVVGADVEGSVQGGVRRVAAGGHQLCGVAGSAHAAARALALWRRNPCCPMTQKRRFVLHQDCEDIAADRICNATRVRSYVTLSGVRAQMSEVVCTYIGSVCYALSGCWIFRA